METTINQRIDLIIKAKEKTAKAFAVKANISSQYVSQLKTAGYSVGLEVVRKIIDLYPDVNANWLINGTGEMLLSGGVKVDKCEKCEYLESLLNSKENEIEILKKLVSVYEGNEGRRAAQAG